MAFQAPAQLLVGLFQAFAMFEVLQRRSGLVGHDDHEVESAAREHLPPVQAAAFDGAAAALLTGDRHAHGRAEHFGSIADGAFFRCDHGGAGVADQKRLVLLHGQARQHVGRIGPLFGRSPMAGAAQTPVGADQPDGYDVGADTVHVASGSVLPVPVTVSAEAQAGRHGAQPLRFTIEALDDPATRVTEQSAFLLP